MHAGAKTLVGQIDPSVLAYTAGEDVQLDRALVEVDCIGTAAHVTMLQEMALSRPLFSTAEKVRVIAALIEVMRRHRAGSFGITAADQDVHLAVERSLTEKLGDLGKRVHTGRSRNDQVAVDLRLFAKQQLWSVMVETAELARVLVTFAAKHAKVPMAGRTHLQPAMPSSVGLWASAHAESLLDDLELLQEAYRQNDRSPLGSAAGYGVPLPIDRSRTSELLGFARPIHNVLYASMARGRCENVILMALTQTMLSVSRLAEDMILFLMPEFGYFRLPPAYCTGSSIMPQKQNPDVFELARARSADVLACSMRVAGILKGLPGGYQRDLQETKAPFMEGLRITRDTVQVLQPVMSALMVDESALRAGFVPGVFATDRALELVAEGVPFRDAYDRVKAEPDALEGRDPLAAAMVKQHEGAPGGLDFEGLQLRAAHTIDFVKAQKECYHRKISVLLGVDYPSLENER
ncbi:MAG: argininosuccinate lyase [Kiritimatiellia bacterium]